MIDWLIHCVTAVRSISLDDAVTSARLATPGFPAVVSVPVKFPASPSKSVTSRRRSACVRVMFRVTNVQNVNQTHSTLKNAIQTAVLSASVLEWRLAVNSHNFDVIRYLINHVQSSTSSLFHMHTHETHTVKVNVYLLYGMELTAMGCHLPYGITQCYLSSDTSEHTPP